MARPGYNGKRNPERTERQVGVFRVDQLGDLFPAKLGIGGSNDLVVPLGELLGRESLERSELFRAGDPARARRLAAGRRRVAQSFERTDAAEPSPFVVDRLGFVVEDSIARRCVGVCTGGSSREADRVAVKYAQLFSPLDRFRGPVRDGVLSIVERISDVGRGRMVEKGTCARAVSAWSSSSSRWAASAPERTDSKGDGHTPVSTPRENVASQLARLDSAQFPVAVSFTLFAPGVLFLTEDQYRANLDHLSGGDIARRKHASTDGRVARGDLDRGAGEMRSRRRVRQRGLVCRSESRRRRIRVRELLRSPACLLHMVLVRDGR